MSATDVIETPLTPGPTDLELDRRDLDSLLRGCADETLPELSSLPAILAERLDSEFRRDGAPAASWKGTSTRQHPA